MSDPEMPPPTRRQVWGWYLFDFANSVLIINGGLYFPQWIVIENKVGDFWFNLVSIVSTVALIVTAPLMGLLSDRRSGRLIFLRATSLAMFIAGLLLAFAARGIEDRVTRSVVSLVSFLVILYTYQLSLVFYNVLLANVTTRSRYARVSGKGLAWGWIGGILGVFIVLPFVQGKVPFFRTPGGMQAVLPSTIIFGVLTVISLVLLGKEPLPTQQPGRNETAGELYRNLLQDFRGIIHNRNVWYFLLAYLLFSDAILTIQNNSPIYMEATMGFPDNTKAMLFVLLLAMSAVGGVLSGYAADFFGLKSTLIWILIGWVVALVATSITTNAIVFSALFGLLGLLNGGLWNVARVLFLILVPSDKRGQYFGIYSSYERFASILGPLIWSAPVSLLSAAGPTRYRVALVAMSILVAISVPFLVKVRLSPEADRLKTPESA